MPTDAQPLVYPPLVPDSLTFCFDVLLLPPRLFRTEKPLTQDAFQVVSIFLQKRCAYPELCRQRTQEDARHADLATLLAAGPPRLLMSRPNMSRPSVKTCGLKHSRMRQALRHTLPSSCLVPPNSSDAMSLGTAVPLLAYPIARGHGLGPRRSVWPYWHGPNCVLLLLHGAQHQLDS